ncbi:endoglucanase 15-like [Phalaenopsis equestris]|uniref:endoglucanase 15-like n=1 Tax=Phalaenopsis equestris TaxID=78828 RepID=UPI0009E62CF7|nr:endoglucanase 15-like [Phalaenopsis equestris]
MIFRVFLALLLAVRHGGAASAGGYKQALTKSLLYFEAQRSGKLPSDQRVHWRGDSALKDGGDVGVDLVGGYYDSGDNVKFGFPMAFTITTLSWAALHFRHQLAAAGELNNALAAISWGTDYFRRAHAAPDQLYVEVGDGDSDHACWQRPEDMTTPRTSYKVDGSNPGADVAGETAAAMAAASLAFRPSDPRYADDLLSHAEQLFEFAKNHPGLYQNSVPVAANFYSSSGFEDELLWAAAWLHRATGKQSYLDFLAQSNNGGVRSMFSWDDKFAGAQLLVSKLILEKRVNATGSMIQYKNSADQFLCSLLQRNPNNARLTPGGLLWFLPWNNLQYTTAALLLLSVHSDHLAAAGASLSCPSAAVSPPEIISFVANQVDYLLGANPRNASYMVGFGRSSPAKVHHRGASIVSVAEDPTPVDCKGGFEEWFDSPDPNPNVIEGAIVGGPDANDGYEDDRSNYRLISGGGGRRR